MNNEPRSNTTIEAVKHSFEIIQALQEHNGAGVTELAAHLDMSKSGIYKHLTTLVEIGFVTQKDYEYQLSFEFLSVAQEIKINNIVYNVGVSEIDDLAEKSRVAAYLVILEDTQAYCIYTAEGENSVGMDIEVGDKIPFHCTCAGKAILSQVPNKKRNSLIGGELHKKTDETINEVSELQEELSTVRQEGIAFEDEENTYGMRGVAAAIGQPQNNTIGAVAISGPVSLIDDERFEQELPELVVQTKNFIEVKSSLTPPTRLR
jgi:DNA-binding IclR family transcriptional regulator